MEWAAQTGSLITLVYLVAGVAWMCAVTVRVLSIMIDKAALPNNFGGVFIEGGVGALLLLGAVSN